jgi:uncharacterized membrane-anchored protein YitT (DUF2179 family)
MRPCRPSRQGSERLVDVEDVLRPVTSRAAAVGVVTVWLGKTQGWNIGRTQFLIDLVILSGAAFILSPLDVAWSALSAASMGLITGIWLRPDRYAGFSKLSRSNRER